jgi:hypothetical protein
MNRLTPVALACIVAAGLLPRAHAGEKEAIAVIDKAIKAMGGEEKLSKIKAFTTKGNGTIVLEGQDIAFKYETTVKGSTQYHSTFEGEANGEKFRGATVLDGDKGWRRLNGDVQTIEGPELANEKRNAYLEIVPTLLLPLKGKEFKVDSAGEEKVGGKPASTVRVTGPDGKDFTIQFDNESGLPVKVSGKVVSWEGEEYTQDTLFEDYKEFDGIKVATKSQTRKNGERFIDTSGGDFKPLDQVSPETFAEPK